MKFIHVAVGIESSSSLLMPSWYFLVQLYYSYLFLYWQYLCYSYFSTTKKKSCNEHCGTSLGWTLGIEFLRCRCTFIKNGHIFPQSNCTKLQLYHDESSKLFKTLASIWHKFFFHLASLTGIIISQPCLPN